MDCEGAEWEIIKDKAAFKHIKYITMEYHLFENQLLDEMSHFLTESNFIIKRKIEYDYKTGIIFAKNVNYLK